MGDRHKQSTQTTTCCTFFSEKSKHLFFKKDYQRGSLSGFGFDCRKCYVAGSVNILGSYDFSLDRKEVAEFKYEQIGSNIYLVTPKNLDSDAEFCFIYTQNMSRGLASGITANFFGANNNRNKVFDFGTN